MPKGRFIKGATYEQKLADLKYRLELFSEPIPFSGCTIYTGFVGSAGYGLITFCKRSISAHRASYMVNKGPIPEGRVIMHKCDVKTCINPDHLIAGTQTDNMRDMIRKGRDRYVRGSDSWSAKLTPDAVRHIRLSGETSTTIAEKLGVHARTIRDVRENKTWKHVI